MTTAQFVVGRFLFRPDSVPPKEESGEIRPFLSPRIVRCFRFFLLLLLCLGPACRNGRLQTGFGGSCSFHRQMALCDNIVGGRRVPINAALRPEWLR